MTANELHAITRLLDDPDVSIYEQIEASILKIGTKIVPILETTWNNSENKLVNNRIEIIIDKINFSNILEEFNVWNSSRELDLLELMILINRLQYPMVNCSTVFQTIENQVKEIWLELNENLTAFERINIINKLVYEMWKFQSINDYTHDVFQYNFVSNLIEHKYGNQFSISCFYLILTEKLDLPVYPVLLEDQLILAYANSHKPPDQLDTDNILFYINPNEDGVVFDQSSIKSWIKKHKLENKASYYLPATSKQLAQAYINRLIDGYAVENDEKKIDFLSTLVV